VARTILIIDDDQELCDLVGELLRGERFEVDAYSTTVSGNPSAGYTATFTVGLAA
jgi:DNA-binding response OmpR family regulator